VVAVERDRGVLRDQVKSGLRGALRRAIGRTVIIICKPNVRSAPLATGRLQFSILSKAK
jgi:hypothetical protein